MDSPSLVLAARFHSTGAPGDVLAVEESDLRNLKKQEVVVRMLAAPVNPSDLLFVAGDYGLIPELPAVAGFEGVGVVESHGGNIPGRLLRGMRVAVIHRTGGTWGTRCVTNCRTIMPVPNAVSNAQAAQFFVNPATALALTGFILKLKRHDWLLQSAGGSVVARLVSALGSRIGFQTIHIVRRAETQVLLLEQGAKHVIVWKEDDGPLRLQQLVKEITGTADLRYAIDPVGGATGTAMFTALSERGRLISYGTLSRDPLNISTRELIAGNKSVEGFWLGPFMDRLSLLRKVVLIRQISLLISRGTFKLDQTRLFPLDDLSAALQFAQSPGRTEKAILTMADM